MTNSKPNTEFYDGINLNIDTGSLEDKTLKEFVEGKVGKLRENPAIENISEIKLVTIGELQGYKFDLEGLRKFTYIYLPGKEGKYLEIIDGTADPTNRGFKETVSRMLSTLKINP